MISHNENQPTTDQTGVWSPEKIALAVKTIDAVAQLYETHAVTTPNESLALDRTFMQELAALNELEI
jgi:hypothetical protein